MGAAAVEEEAEAVAEGVGEEAGVAGSGEVAAGEAAATVMEATVAETEGEVAVGASGVERVAEGAAGAEDLEDPCTGEEEIARGHTRDILKPKD